MRRDEERKEIRGVPEGHADLKQILREKKVNRVGCREKERCCDELKGQ